MQGEDFAELYLEDDKKWRKEFYYEWPDPFEQAHYIPAVQALIRKDYKYIYWPQHNYHQFVTLNILFSEESRNNFSVKNRGPRTK